MKELLSVFDFLCHVIFLVFGGALMILATKDIRRPKVGQKGSAFLAYFLGAAYFLLAVFGLLCDFGILPKK